MSSFIDTDTTMRALQFSLDGLAKRAEVTSANIANADTPNYKASNVTFESSLRQALAGTQTGSLPLTLTDGADINPDQTGTSATISQLTPQSLVNKNDNNNVDVESEMTTLAQTNLMYDAMVQLSTSQLGIIKSSLIDLKP